LIKKNYIEIVFLIFLGAASSLSLPPIQLFNNKFFYFSAFFIFYLKNLKLLKVKNISFFMDGYLDLVIFYQAYIGYQYL
jgi:apolipoprotein N-acyltransferase